MKKIFILLFIALFLMNGCTGKEPDDEEILTQLKENNTAEKLKERFKEIYYKDERLSSPVSVYDDTESTVVNDFREDKIIRTQVYEKDFVYTLENNDFSQKIVQKEKDDVWNSASRFLDALEFESVEKTDVFYIVRAHMKKESLASFYEDKAASATMSLLVDKKDFTLTSVQNETLTLDDGTKKELKQFEYLYNGGNLDPENADLVKKHFAENKEFRSCTIVSDPQQGEKTSVQYSIAKGVRSGVLLKDGYTIIQRLSTLDNELRDNDVTYYITDKDSEEMEKVHEGSLSKDNIYPDDASNFVILSQYIPDLLLEIRYATTYNFVGEVIDGYKEPIALLSLPAAKALKEVNDDLLRQGYRLKIYDAYRPQMAVDHFKRWASDLRDTRMKDVFYENVDKKDLFALGYVADQSSHSRGSTVDLTIVDEKTGKEVDMGSVFDLFAEISHSDYADLSEEQLANRKILSDAMTAHGFMIYEEEWWHYTLANEPYPNTYFIFPNAASSLQ